MSNDNKYYQLLVKVIRKIIFIILIIMIIWHYKERTICLLPFQSALPLTQL